MNLPGYLQTMANVTEPSSILAIDSITDYNGELVTWSDRNGNRRYNARSEHTQEICSFWSITGAKHWLSLIHCRLKGGDLYTPSYDELATIYD